jgi:hypothetical protein
MTKILSSEGKGLGGGAAVAWSDFQEFLLTVLFPY